MDDFSGSEIAEYNVKRIGRGIFTPKERKDMFDTIDARAEILNNISKKSEVEVKPRMRERLSILSYNQLENIDFFFSCE
jgi:hypothetical protein